VESNAATASFVCGLGGVSRLDALTLNYTSAAQIVSLLTQSVKGCGINLGSNILIPPTATNMLPYVTSLVNKRSSSSHADSVLLLDIFGSALVNALKQGNALQMSTGYRASIDSATAWFQSAEALAPNVPPTYAITQYYYTAFQNSSNQEFVRDFQKKYHTVPNNENYQGYANALAMIAAIKKAHSFDAASVAKAFPGLTFSDPQGTTTVDPSTHVAPSSFTVVLYEGSSSKLIKVIRPSNG
jgi:ABC-type branched-subunit amino acid transport system substrate-binding protein